MRDPLQIATNTSKACGEASTQECRRKESYDCFVSVVSRFFGGMSVPLGAMDGPTKLKSHITETSSPEQPQHS